MLKTIIIPLILQLIFSCSYSVSKNNNRDQLARIETTNQSRIDTAAGILYERYSPPEDFVCIASDSNSFAYYLQHLPLKKHGSRVRYFNNSLKPGNGVYCAVVDLSIGNRDLQQCADAVMRLRAEYLFSIKAFNKIHFNFVSDGKPRYYLDYAQEDFSYPVFCKYLDYIFSYANTRSLFNELTAVEDAEDMNIGDVLIQKGNPYGHAVIVVNMAEHKQTGNKLFMLAQSYMPAQDIQILINPDEPEISPWYSLKEGIIRTPEWIFNSSDLRRFAE